jgi:hypothetical protein
MTTVYDFDIATQTGNGKVNDGILGQQLVDAGLSSGGTFEGLSVEGGKIDGRGLLSPPGTIKLAWQNALDAADLAAQAALVGAHNGVKYVREFARRGAISLQTEGAGVYTSVFAAGGGPLVLTPVEAGVWRVTFYCEVQLQSAPGSATDRVQVQITDGGSEIAQSNDSTEHWKPGVSGSRVFSKESGESFDVDMLFRRRGAGMTAEIRRCQIQIELVKGD